MVPPISSVCTSASSHGVSQTRPQAVSSPPRTKQRLTRVDSHPGWISHSLSGQPVPGSGHHPRDQMCPLCLNAESPFASCVPALRQCAPPERAQLPVLLAHMVFSTASLAICVGLSHPWHRGLHLSLLNFVRFPSAHFFSCHLL